MQFDLSGIDPVPKIWAGVETVTCECGWEIVRIVPEEHDWSLILIVQHLAEHNDKPVITVKAL